MSSHHFSTTVAGITLKLVGLANQNVVTVLAVFNNGVTEASLVLSLCQAQHETIHDDDQVSDSMVTNGLHFESFTMVYGSVACPLL